MALLPSQLSNFPPPESLKFCTEATLPARLERIEWAAERSGVPFRIRTLGHSREGRPLPGIALGKGPRKASLTAGAHADEPVGPIAALALAEWLASEPGARPLLEAHTWLICPQVNPDGAEANRAWFRDPPDPLEYLVRAVREPPGEDVEFGYPDPRAPAGEGTPAIRPEKAAVAKFLKAHAPIEFHASLHGMAVAEGAWFLINAAMVGRTAPLRERLRATALEMGFDLHDVDRKGEKGFHRIEPGFSTTPTSTGMREHFLARDDPETAELFRLSSMEFVEALGGDPLAMVSELPLFAIRAKRDGPSGESPYRRLMERVPELRRRLMAGDAAPVRRAIEEFDLHPTPLDVQVHMQALMVLEGLRARRALNEGQ